MATVDYAVKYAGKVDEKLASISKSDKCINKNFDFVGAKTVKVYTVATSPLNDYQKTGTNRYGSPEELDATTQEMTMTQDKSFTFSIDKMTNDETGGAVEAGTALARELREVVAPYLDTYRYAKMATGAGTKATPKALTAENVYDEIITATEVLDDAEVTEVDRFIVVTPATYKLMKASKECILDTEIGQEMKLRGVVAIMDGMEVIKVPSKKLPTNAGFLVGHPMATTSPVKLAEYKIHDDAPGISGKLVEGRIYFDAFVLDNKAKALYYHAIA